MSNLARAMMMGAAGASGDPVYVDDVFSTYLYVGNSSTQTITNGIDLSGEGGLVWTKVRTNATFEDHTLVDSERGDFQIKSNSTDGNNAIVSFNFASAGYTVPNSTRVNTSGEDYASWTFRKAPGFFDVVTYTGNGTTQAIPHSLGSVPGMILVKKLNASADWNVYHRSTGAGQYLKINSENAASASTANWANTAPTSTHFTVGTGNNTHNNGDSFVAYIFAHDDAQFGTGGNESIIKCGSYTGTLSEQFIDLGFEPQFLLHKRSNGSSDWKIFDNMRGWSAGAQERLYANNNDAEGSASGDLTLTSTGFREPGTTSAVTNIYMAIRRPHKPPEAATDVFAMDYGSGSSSAPNWDSGFPVDFAIWRENPAAVNNNHLSSRLTGTKYMRSNLTNAEAGAGNITWDSNVGYGKGYSSAYLSWMFKRAPGFMDVVAYTGDGSSNRQISHNLNAVPELMIFKQRDASRSWAVYSAATGVGKFLKLEVDALTTQSGLFDTAPTSSIFTVETNTYVNISSGKYIAYLFATLPGISKVGSYSGSSSAVDVDCGFTNGARFVLIKRTDQSGNWYLFDTTRGIVSGNDPALWLNSSNAQITNTDYIDPLSSGFTVTTASGDINESGGTYIFLAIA